ncbi:MAG: hypothetical protein JXA41_12810 [Deltaproteobacteria bacterium]|nr:hypothetical protein [Deltaproteobacteria bacterium]
MKTTSSEIDLFNHEDFGEGYLAMAYHVREMSPLDRVLFEDCTVADGAVVAPHLNVRFRCPVHLRPEYLQKRIGCTFQQAAILADAWSIIEATAKMVDAFIVWIKARGIDQAVAYFEKLARQLAEVEVPGDDDAGDEAYEEEIPDLYGWHVIGYDELAEAMELTWEERQPRSYKSLLNEARGLDDLDALRSLGKKVFALRLGRHQAGVFWHEYRKSEKRILAAVKKALGCSARGLLNQIRNANGNLAALGARLYRVQSGAVKMAEPPRKHEWIVIWAAYHDRQAALRS